VKFCSIESETIIDFQHNSHTNQLCIINKNNNIIAKECSSASISEALVLHGCNILYKRNKTFMVMLHYIQYIAKTKRYTSNNNNIIILYNHHTIQD
jgi:hypothetical protein